MKSTLRFSIIIFVFLGAQAALLWALDVSPYGLIAWLFGVDQFQFAYPWLLLTLLPVVPLSVMAFTRVGRKVVGTMAFTRSDLFAGSPRTFRNVLRPLLPLFRVGAIVAICLALSRPQIAKVENVEVDGIDIYVVLDMSGSMQAIDLTHDEVRQYEIRGESPPSRFDIAKNVLRDFVVRRSEKPWSDRVGMVIFARKAFLQFPLTVDYQTVMWLLERLQLNDIDASETAIGNALGQAVTGLIDSDGESKIIILITDGDERGGNMSAVSTAQVAADQGIQIFPILVGREGPVLVPQQRVYGMGMRYDQREYPVDPELLAEVANLSGGEFFRAENREELETSLERILEAYERTRFEDMIQHQNEDVFYPFVWAGFFFLGFELFLLYGVVRKFP